jgi:hypothetical protein
MKCSKCGTVSVTMAAPFCSTCGASLVLGGTMPAIPPPPVQRRTSGMAITGFVLSFFCGVLGLIFSIIGLRECKRSSGKVTGEGLAIAGIIVSILTTITMILMWYAFTRFVDSVDRAFARPEAKLQLERMARSAKSYYYRNGSFPTMSAPLTPRGSCCEQYNERCEGDWTSPAWRELDFEIYLPTHFRYSYSSDRNLFQATAVGDPGCDGDELTYRLTVDASSGSPEVTIEAPPDVDE